MKDKKIIIFISIVILVLISSLFIIIYQINKNDKKFNLNNDNNFYIQSGKLFITDKDKKTIQVPGDFSEMDPSDYEIGTYQSNMNFEKVYFYYKLEGKIYLTISKDINNNEWNQKELTSENIGIPENSKIKYIRISGNYGYIFYINPRGDGKILKTTTEGEIWQKCDPDCVLNDECELNFLNENGLLEYGFLTVPSEDGEKCDLYLVENSNESTYKKIDFASVYDTAKKLDYYYMPTLENFSILTLSIMVGEDKNDTDTIEFYSNDGGYNWLDKKQYDNKIKNQKIQYNNITLSYDKFIDELDSNTFLKDFKNYNMDSNEINISEEKAKEIAEIGFKEAAKRIVLEGIVDTAYESIKIEEVHANNFFTRKITQSDCIYSDITRKTYVVTKENSMGNGVSVYVDATNGLIIGGEAFGD